MKMIATSLLFVLATFSSTLAGPLNQQVLSELDGENVMTRIGAVNEESDLDLFEGDIQISNDRPQNDLVKRNAQQSRKYLWREKKNLPQELAPVNGHWGRWLSWSACSSSCGPGTMFRTRDCDDPSPANGGSPCSGSGRQDLSCVYQSCGLGPNDCEFEEDENKFCQWRQDTTDELDWVRAGDHTSGDGHVLYLNNISPTKQDQKARLISQSIQGSESSVCLIVSYIWYAHRNSVSLNIYMDNTAGRNLVANETADGGEAWHTIRVNLTSASSYQVIIEGVRGTGYGSTVNIDNVMLIPGSCSAIPLRNLGCYNDNSRPLETFYKNFRDYIDWFDMTKTVKECAREAKKKKYKVFGVEFYGECWSSLDAKDVYNKDGASDNCWNGVGKHYSFQAYELV